MDIIVGIDVSKERLDISIAPLGTAFFVENSHAGLDDLIGRLKATHGAEASCVVALEATGGFEMLAAAGLSSAGFAVIVVNPAQVRAYANAIGRRAKTDPIDAEVIAASWLRRGRKSAPCGMPKPRRFRRLSIAGGRSCR